MLKSILKKSTALLLAVICTLSFTTSCSKSDKTESTGKPQVQIEMENGDKMVLELYPEYAPETVNNFVSLAESGFYDGLTFHRIVKGFMIQGGDPKGDGTGGSEKNIKGEFSGNGFEQNTLSHTRGVISMARSQDPNSASSQFFIVHADSAFLDGQYAAFGKLISGEDVLDKIADTPVEANPFSGEVSVPTEPVKIKTVKVLSK
ncbi:peptidylprolyl isomerase [Ruminiclostridium herbifermentans]|uniref:Peptidyl-prolyl cis-trans isomerase n=1 Tax=Ruminiclostridium herbifermentans TaxID=2488810 RepID=A0A4U7JJJ5_9FIRM|nr:peptidylprolyl isomerase [Ruminiclostridium herbifermentans]QNU67444.1 peptidylprolyl isomerase [Ruminiclostridium herbifermentans]